VTAVATAVFLATKFTAGAWVVVLAIPALIGLFVRIHVYYDRSQSTLGVGRIPSKPHPRRTMVVVPVTGVSRLTQHAIAQALSISQQVVAVHVVVEDTGQTTGRDRELQQQWARWNPGVPLRVLRTEFASVTRPIVELIDELHERHDDQIVVLIPMVRPDRLRDNFLHNHLDLVLAAALRTRTDVVVARAPMSLRLEDGARTSRPVTDTGSERTNTGNR
jgi:hypothetical protein